MVRTIPGTQTDFSRIPPAIVVFVDMACLTVLPPVVGMLPRGIQDLVAFVRFSSESRFRDAFTEELIGCLRTRADSFRSDLTPKLPVLVVCTSEDAEILAKALLAVRSAISGFRTQLEAVVIWCSAGQRHAAAAVDHYLKVATGIEGINANIYAFSPTHRGIILQPPDEHRLFIEFLATLLATEASRFQPQECLTTLRFKKSGRVCVVSLDSVRIEDSESLAGAAVERGIASAFVPFFTHEARQRLSVGKDSELASILSTTGSLTALSNRHTETLLRTVAAQSETLGELRERLDRLQSESSRSISELLTECSIQVQRVEARWSEFTSSSGSRVWASLDGIFESYPFPALHWFERGPAKPQALAARISSAIESAVSKSREQWVKAQRVEIESERFAWLSPQISKARKRERLAESMGVDSSRVESDWPTLFHVPPCFAPQVRDEICHLADRVGILDVLELTCG